MTRRQRLSRGAAVTLDERGNVMSLFWFLWITGIALVTIAAVSVRNCRRAYALVAVGGLYVALAYLHL